MMLVEEPGWSVQFEFIQRNCYLIILFYIFGFRRVMALFIQILTLLGMAAVVEVLIETDLHIAMVLHIVTDLHTAMDLIVMDLTGIEWDGTVGSKISQSSLCN